VVGRKSTLDSQLPHYPKLPSIAQSPWGNVLETWAVKTRDSCIDYSFRGIRASCNGQISPLTERLADGTKLAPKQLAEEVEMGDEGSLQMTRSAPIPGHRNRQPNVA